MKIIPLFINFLDKILSIKLLGIELIDWLITFSIIIIVFKIIQVIGNSHSSSKSKKKESENKND